MKICEKCGKEILENENCCPNCGADSLPNAKPKKSKKKILITIIAILTVLLIAGCSVIAVLNEKNQNYAQEISQMLEGKTFEKVDSNNDVVFMAQTIKFENGQRIYDQWLYMQTQKDEPWDHHQSIREYEIEVPLFGTPTVDGHEIIIEDNKVVSLSDNSGEMKPVDVPAISKKAVDIFSGLGWEWNGIVVSFGTLIPEVFKEYTIYVDPCVDEEFCFDIKVSGEYYPNKLNMSYYTEEGSFSCKLNIKTQNGTDLKVDNELSTAFNMQVAYNHIF